MKTTLAILSSFLTFAFVLRSLPVVAIATLDPVLDIAGQKLHRGINYYILPVLRNGGGGLTLASTGNEICPLDVVQMPFEVEYGLPLTFSPVNLTQGAVRLSTDLNIKFSALTFCVQSTVWRLDNYDGSSGQWFVTTGGVIGNPGPQTTRNWFKIEKFDDDYKLVFCSGECNCHKICRDIGIYNEGGIRRLALSDAPFKVMFQKD